MKKIYILLTSLCLIINSSFSQQYRYTPTSSVSIPASSLNPVGIENAVNSLERPFTDKEINFLKTNLDSCQAMIDRNITKLKNECYDLMQNKTKLEQLRNVEQLANDIKEKEEKIQVLKQDALNQLLGIYYQGVYAAVLDCNWKDEKDPLAERTRNATIYYAKRQMTDSIKTLIESIEGTKTITDYLLEHVKGKVSVEEEMISSKIDGQTKYILISKATYYPFEEEDTEYKRDRKVKVTNLVPLFDVTKKLKEYNVTEEDMQEYKDIIDKKINFVKEENFNISKKVQNIIMKKKDMYTVLYTDLVNLKDILFNREEHIERIITSNTEIGYDKKAFDNSIDEATKYFQKKIEAKIDSMISEKSKELIPSKYNVNVALTNSPVSSISESVFSIARQLEKLNYEIKDFSDFTSENIVREVDKIWVYPTAGNNDNFLVTVVASFKMRRNVSSTTYPGMADNVGQNFEYYRDPVTERDYAFLKGGKFQMGSNEGQIDEKPVHEVELADFYIGKSEVTNKEFCDFLNNEGNKMENDAWWLDISDEDCKIYKKEGVYYVKDGFEEYPVVEVTWYGARAFCKWLSQETGRIYRLPSEAEWEYAAQGGLLSKNLKYSGSNSPDDCAWYNKNSSGKAQRVCQKQPNEIGVFDMSGNVWEWCTDIYVSNYYKTSPSVNPKGAEKGYNRSIRGGAWFYDESYLRTANRSSFSPDFSSVYIGFRIVMQK